VGWYPLIRLAFDSSLFAVPYYQNQVPAFATAFVEDGVITSISMQNNGSGYAAKPLVTIAGNGAGARAEAIWDPATGAVTGITVLDGGSGYWRIPNAAITGGHISSQSPKSRCCCDHQHRLCRKSFVPIKIEFTKNHVIIAT
jgi:hypothetical protein